MSDPSADASGVVGTDVHDSHMLAHSSGSTPGGGGQPHIFLPCQDSSWASVCAGDIFAVGAWVLTVPMAPATRRIRTKKMT